MITFSIPSLTPQAISGIDYGPSDSSVSLEATGASALDMRRSEEEGGASFLKVPEDVSRVSVLAEASSSQFTGQVQQVQQMPKVGGMRLGKKVGWSEEPPAFSLRERIETPEVCMTFSVRFFFYN